MYCQKCGEKNDNDSRFCMSCGEKLISVNNQGNVQTEEAQVSTSNNSMDQNKSYVKKAGSKGVKIGGIVVGILVLVLILSSVLGSGSSGKILGVIYQKDGELYVTNNDKSGERFSDDEYNWRGPSGEKRDYIYFVDDYDYSDQEGDLKLKRLGKDLIDIEDSVYESYMVSLSGRRVLFLTDFDGVVGDLQLSVDGKKPEKIAEDVPIGFVFGEDETEIAYISDFNLDDSTGSLYYKKEGKEAQEIDDDANFPLLIKKGRKEIYFAKKYDYYKESFDMYLKSGKNDIERISKGITSIVYNKDYSKSIEISHDDDWNINFELRKSNKDSERIDKNVTSMYSLGSITEETIEYYQNFYGNDKILHADKNQDVFTIYAKDYDKVYVYKEGHKSVELMDYENYGYSTTDANCNVIAYIDNDDDTLYTTTFKNGELTEPHEIDDDVYSVLITEDGKNVVYLKDYKNGSAELFVANINGEPEEIADDVSLYFSASADGKEFMFIDEDSTLFYAKRGKDAKEIAEDVSNFTTIDFKTVYYRDHNYELFKGNLGKEPVSIDDDVDFFILLGDFNN